MVLVPSAGRALATGGRSGVGEGLRRRGFLGGEGSGEDDMTTWDYRGYGQCLNDFNLNRNAMCYY